MMADEIELCSDNKTKQVLVQMKGLGFNVEPPSPAFGPADLIEDQSVRSKLIRGVGYLVGLLIFTLDWIDLAITVVGYKCRDSWRMSGQNSEETWSGQSLALLVSVMGIFAAGAYVVLFSFDQAFPISILHESVNLSTWDLLTFPRAATGDFLVLTTVTTTFIFTMGMITITVCFIFRKFARGTFFTILFLSAVAAFSLSFFAMLSKFIPHSITIAGGNLKVPATFIVIFYDIYVIILVCALACTAQCLSSFWRKKDADVGRRIVV